MINGIQLGYQVNQDLLDMKDLIGNMRANSKIRGEQVVEITSIFTRIIRYLADLLSGGSKKCDREAFAGVYQQLNSGLEEVKTLFEQKKFQVEHIATVRVLLEIQTKLQLLDWHHNLTDEKTAKKLQKLAPRIKKAETLGELLNLEAKKSELEEKLKQNESEKYTQYRTQMEEIHKLALKALQSRKVVVDNETRRWIESTPFERKFAVSSESGKIPFKAEHIPSGAILLTDVKSYMLGLKLKGFKPTVEQRFRKFKGYLNEKIFGTPYIHSEISIGGGKFFHQDKEEGADSLGVGMFEERIGRDAHSYCILVPNEDEILKATGKKSFKDEILSPMLQEIDEYGKEIKTTFSSMLKVAFQGSRSEDYDPTQALDYEGAYACSAAIASLYGKFGLDIGEEFGKTAQHVSPTDLFHSKYFKVAYSREIF